MKKVEKDFSMMRGARAHHADGKSQFDIWHNGLHEAINSSLESLRGGGGGDDLVKKAKTIMIDATQLSTSARLLGADGVKHVDDVKIKLNELLPASDKYTLSNGKKE